MKATDPFELPYPECQPPLTKDASDIAQLRDLALAVDTQVTELVTFAGDEFISPDGCKLSRTSSIALNNGDVITWQVIDFDNSPGGVMDEVNGIRIRQSGYYFVAGWISTQQTLDNTRVLLWVEGTGEILNEGIATGAGAGTQMTGSVVVGLSAGQLVQQRLSVAGSGTTVLVASLAVVRITGI